MSAPHEHAWAPSPEEGTRQRTVYRCPCGAAGYRFWPKTGKVQPIVEYKAPKAPPTEVTCHPLARRRIVSLTPADAAPGGVQGTVHGTTVSYAPDAPPEPRTRWKPMRDE